MIVVPEEKTDLCQVSLTGLRAIAMLGLLVQYPRTLEDIREKFLEAKLIDPQNTNDIIRIDMNTLRSMDCEISRSSLKTGNKYHLIKHPFTIDITEEEVVLLKRAYKIIRDESDIETLLKYHELFCKLASSIYDTDIKERILGISVLKRYNIELLKQYIKDCEYGNTLVAEYKDAGHSVVKQRTIVAQKLQLRNGKIYMLGYDVDKKESSMFPINRIVKVIYRSCSNSGGYSAEPVVVKFKLKNFNAAGMEEDEKIIESRDDMTQIIEGKYHNEFVAVQRMLSFGPACTVLEPENIKQKVIEKLLAMKEVYKNA